MVKIGIPKAFLYYRYHHLWETFLTHLGIDYIVSPDTNKDIMNSGMTYAIDEACLSSKIYLGHVAWLRDKCDYILVPRISTPGHSGSVCTKFLAIYDVVKNTFREDGIRLLYYNIDLWSADIELRAFLKMGRFLGKKRSQTMVAYLVAKQAEKAAQLLDEYLLDQQLQETGIKILIVSHRYNICDGYIGGPIQKLLRQQGAVPIIGDYANRRETLERSNEISATLPWSFNRELVGAVALLKRQVDGIILMTTFPCGPDSLVNEILLRKVKDIPMINLIVDGQEGTAGLETRIESFLDIIRFKKEDGHAGF
ncbi:MAG: acyl-CoA dehydratase activase-related protein [Bacillota bacterium]|nr:acyl-CoA dehydratase activase-related protein [Bacillota bacterium]